MNQPKNTQCQSLISLIIVLILATMSFMSSSRSYDQDTLVTCLARHNITNLTTSHNEEHNHDHDHILNFSLQNLRFACHGHPKPFAIILPETKDQLVNSIICSKAAKLEIRVRGGGHSYEGLSTIASDGAPYVIIEMMNLINVEVDLESETAWVQGGATLGELYYSIAENSSVHGFPGGSCPSVGVGGLVSGGGFGFLSRKHGLAADNVVDAILVDAKGRVLDHAAMGEEVFWAIRGGGGGIWGVIYAWKIKLIRVPETVTAFTVSKHGEKGNTSELVHKWQLVASFLEDSLYLSVTLGAETEGIKRRALATFKGLYLGPKDEAMSTINEAFPELGMGEDDCLEMSWIESMVYFSGLGERATTNDLRSRQSQQKIRFKAKSDYVKSPIPLDAIRAILDMLGEEPKGNLIFDPYGGAMERIRKNAIAFPHRHGNLFSIQYMVSWSEQEKENSKRCQDWLRRLYSFMEPFVSASPRAAYVNYVDLDLGAKDPDCNGNCSGDAVEKAREWGKKYFLGNYDRLVRAKTMIDPGNVFRHQQGIPPLQFKVVDGKGSDKECKCREYLDSRFCFPGHKI